MDDAVARAHVSEGDGRVVDHHATVDGEGERLTVDRVRRHALGHVGGRHVGADHVVEQDVGERGLAFRGVKRGQVNAGVDEGLVRGCEDRERSSALQGFEQFRLDHTGDQ